MKPPTFEEAFARRRQVRKSAGPPAPLPAEVKPVLASFGAALEASDADPAAALEQAIQAAAAEIIAKAVAAVTGALPPAAPVRPTRKARPPMATTATEYVAKGGSVWPRIEAGAAKLRGQTAGTMTKTEMAQAVSAFLDTPEGRRLYEDYLAEADVVATQESQRRRDDGR